MSKPPDRMLPAEIVGEIGSLCGELRTKLARIQQLSDRLYHHVRRLPADDNTAVYMRYASTWGRFASMTFQGVRRASAGDKVLRGLTSDATGSVVKPAVKPATVAPTPVESLLEMYREDSARPVTEAD